MQIKTLVLYGHHNQKKELNFELGKLNIIKGIASSGKSALSEIIEYCIGRGKCMIPSGEIRERVSWYGILFQLKNSQIFVARKAPEGNNMRSSMCYYEEGKKLTIPQKIEESNIDFDKLILKLSDKIGIPNGLTLSISTHYDVPQPITIKNALYYAFQPQDEIGQRGMLFHRQGEKMRPTLISKTLPFFLGAIPDDFVQLQFRLDKERKEKYRLNQDFKEIQEINTQGILRAKELFDRAQSLALINRKKFVEEIHDYRIHFKEALDWRPNIIRLSDSSELPKFRRLARNLEQKISQLDESINEVQDYQNEISGYHNEIIQQEMRLESIDLFKSEDKEKNQCPLCSSILNSKLDSIFQINKSLDELKRDLIPIAKEKPQIDDYIKQLESEKSSLQSELKSIFSKIENELHQEEEGYRLRNLDMERANLQGQIQFWLDSVTMNDPKSELQQQINEKNNIINEIETKINETTIKQELQKSLIEVSSQISQWAKKLQLGYSEYPVFLDIKQPSLLFNKNDSYQPFQTIGGGKNWLSYHVLIHLSLHKYFIEHERPVPSFLLLDQPSSSHSLSSILEFYDLLKDILKKLHSKMQIIVTEQIDFDDSNIDDSIKYTWTETDKLIPDDWTLQD